MIKKGISLSMIGLIISVFTIGSVSVSIYLSKHLSKFNYQKIIIISQISLLISSLTFMILKKIDKNWLCVLISISGRLIQGSAIGGSSTVIYSYIPDLYPNEMDEKFGILEMNVGIGIAVGPIISGYLYEYTNYEISNLIISGIILVFSIFFCFLFNKNLYPELKLDNNNSNTNIEENNEEINFSKFITNRNFLLTLFVHVVCLIAYTLIQPSFSEHIKYLGGTPQTIGLIFALCEIAYGFGSLFLLKYIRYYKRKYVFIFGGIITILSLLIIGPEPLIFLPPKLIIVGAGMTLLGFGAIFYMAPIIPEFVDIFKEIFGENKSIHTMAGGIFQVSVSIAEFIGPLLGGTLTDYIGFERGLTVYSIFMIVYLTFYAFMRKIKRNNNVLIERELKKSFL